MDDLQKANLFADEIANLLGVRKPRIRWAKELELLTPTQWGAAIGKGDYEEIIIRRNQPLYTYMFVIAHELRHMYQVRHWTFEHSDNLSVETTKYNEQEEEIDANGFAVAMMAAYFGVRPKLEEALGIGMTQETLDAIQAKSKELFAQYMKDIVE